MELTHSKLCKKRARSENLLYLLGADVSMNVSSLRSAVENYAIMENKNLTEELINNNSARMIVTEI